MKSRWIALVLLSAIAVSSAVDVFADDFTKVFQEESRGAVGRLRNEAQDQPAAQRELDNTKADEATLLIQSQGNQILQLKVERDDLLKQVKDLEAMVARLATKAVEAKSQPVVFVGTATWCGVCRQWEEFEKAHGTDLPKEWFDLDGPRPIAVPEGEWNAIQANRRAWGGRLPIVWWRDKTGELQYLVGRYKNWQIRWSIDEANRLIDLKARAQ